MSAPPNTPTPSEAALDPVGHALCRSAVWEALALGFRRPTDETRTRLVSLEGAAALADAAAELDRVAGTDLALLARALAIEPAPTVPALDAVWGRLFGHTARGTVTPYETEYGDDSLWQPQRDMSDLTGFFRAFGLTLRSDAGERPDHIACEAEFMAVLARKEAVALEIADNAMAEETARATRLFLRDHLGRWAPAFAASVARGDPRGFHGALGRLCATFVEGECRRLGVPTGPEFLRLRSAEPDDVPAACGPSAPVAGP